MILLLLDSNFWIRVVMSSVLMLSTGLVHARTRQGMNAKPPTATSHVQGAPRDDRHRGVEAAINRHRGGPIGNGCRPGRAMRDAGHQGGMRRDAGHRGGARRNAGHQGGIVTVDRPQSQNHPLNECLQRGWLRNYWKHQV